MYLLGLAISLLQSHFADLPQILLGRQAVGRLELRRVVDAQLQLAIALFGDPTAGLNCLRIRREDSRHLLWTSHVELVAGEAEAFLVVHRLAGVDAQQNLVGLRVLAL